MVMEIQNLNQWIRFSYMIPQQVNGLLRRQRVRYHKTGVYFVVKLHGQKTVQVIICKFPLKLCFISCMMENPANRRVKLCVGRAKYTVADRKLHCFQ